jgi:hypothetical protein
VVASRAKGPARARAEADLLHAAAFNGPAPLSPRVARGISSCRMIACRAKRPAPAGADAPCAPGRLVTGRLRNLHRNTAYCSWHPLAARVSLRSSGPALACGVGTVTRRRWAGSGVGRDVTSHPAARRVGSSPRSRTTYQQQERVREAWEQLTSKGIEPYARDVANVTRYSINSCKRAIQILRLREQHGMPSECQPVADQPRSAKERTKQIAIRRGWWGLPNCPRDSDRGNAGESGSGSEWQS